MNILGAQSYEEVLKKEKISKDPKLNEMVNRIGKRIAKASGADFAWEFKVIDNAETVNAFCLPGGKVAVYTGILPIAKNEAALAAVMGHEVAHATLKHGAERMSQQLATQAGLAAASLSLKNSAQRDLILGGIGLGAQFGVLLPYSRKHETEADIVGLKYLAKAGYDPKESVGLWERMAKTGGKVPEIISTHPDPARRARDLEAEIPKVMALYDKSEKQPSKPL
jgi:predicted Zn-dependent protease